MRTLLAPLTLSLLLACESGTDDGLPVDSGMNNTADANTGSDAGGNADAGATDGGNNNVTCDPDFGMADACGGDLEGTWTYRVACGTTPVSAALEQQCQASVINAESINNGTGSLAVTGGSFTLDVTVDVHVEAAVPKTCIAPATCAQGAQAYQASIPGSTVTCTDTGTACDCTIDGPVSSFGNGTVTTNNGVATLNSGETYYYCVQGNTLTYRQFDGSSEFPVYVLDK